MGVIYKTEEEKTEPKAREIMMGFVSFSGLPPFRQKTKKSAPSGSAREPMGSKGKVRNFPRTKTKN